MGMTFSDWDKDPNYLAHFGTKGMKWGQRRFQNPDGSLTALGKERYGKNGGRSSGGIQADLNKLDSEQAYTRNRIKAYEKKVSRLHTRKVKAVLKGNLNKAAKIDEKTNKLKSSKQAKRNEEYVKLLKKSEAMTSRIINFANSKNLRVTSKQIKRQVNVGRNLAITLLATTATTLALHQLKPTIPIGTRYTRSPISYGGRLAGSAAETVQKGIRIKYAGFGPLQYETGRKYKVRTKKKRHTEA